MSNRVLCGSVTRILGRWGTTVCRKADSFLSGLLTLEPVVLPNINIQVSLSLFMNKQMGWIGFTVCMEKDSNN